MYDDLIISIPATLIDVPLSERTVVRSSACTEIATACKQLGERVIGAELEGPATDIAYLSDVPVGLSLVWKLHPNDATQIYTNTWLSDRFSLAVLMDTDRGLFNGLKIVTSATVPAIINLDILADASELMSALHYYLHDTHLQVPLEFFHSLFLAKIGYRTVSLTDIYPEAPDKFLYVDKSGRVTASSRMARAGMFFGSVEGGLRLDEESALYKSLLDLKRHLFLSCSSCVSCEGFEMCGGYLRLLNSTYDCTPFLEVFKEIRVKAKEIADDLSRESQAGE